MLHKSKKKCSLSLSYDFNFAVNTLSNAKHNNKYFVYTKYRDKSKNMKRSTIPKNIVIKPLTKLENKHTKTSNQKNIEEICSNNNETLTS